MIHALTTTEREAMRAELIRQGFELAPTGPCIITGRNGSDCIPAMLLDKLERNGKEWLPIQEPVCMHDGGWWKTDGVRAVERVA